MSHQIYQSYGYIKILRLTNRNGAVIEVRCISSSSIHRLCSPFTGSAECLSLIISAVINVSWYKFQHYIEKLLLVPILSGKSVNSSAAMIPKGHASKPRRQSFTVIPGLNRQQCWLPERIGKLDEIYPLFYTLHLYWTSSSKIYVHNVFFKHAVEVTVDNYEDFVLIQDET